MNSVYHENPYASTADSYPLNAVKHTLNASKGRTILELPLNLLARVVRRRLAVECHQSTEVELGGLQQLNLADVDLRKKEMLVWLFVASIGKKQLGAINLRAAGGRCPGWPSRSRGR